jgi:hypothetical protein
MSWLRERFVYQRIATTMESASVLTTKDSWLWTALWIVGLVLTLGTLAIGLSLRKFLEGTATAFGPWQGYPRHLRELVRRLVAHEGRHTTQTTWFGWLIFPIAWISRRVRSVCGLPLFALVYFVLPFPILLAAGRFYLERDADRAAWRLGLEEGWMTTGEVILRAGQRAESLSGGTYFYAWPRPWARKSYEKLARDLVYEATRS